MSTTRSATTQQASSLRVVQGAERWVRSTAGGGACCLGMLAFLCLAFSLRNVAYLVLDTTTSSGRADMAASAFRLESAMHNEEGLPSVRVRVSDELLPVMTTTGTSKGIVANSAEKTKGKKIMTRKKNLVNKDSQSAKKSQTKARATSLPTTFDPATLLVQEDKQVLSTRLLSKNYLLHKIQAAKDNLKTKLLGNYKEHYWQIFEPNQGTSIGQHYLYKSPGQIMETLGFQQKVNDASQGWKRMARLFQIKLLQVQTGIIKQQQLQQLQHPEEPSYLATLKWITSGNGQASGSGNFFRESFTAVLEGTLQKPLKSFGIKFTAQNYAMKSTSSGDEIALCQDNIYPPSDIMFWDFDMTDEKDYWKLALFGHRLARNSTTALIAYTRTKGHTAVLTALEKRGMTVLGRDWQVQAMQNMAFPDSAALADAQLKDLPPLLQYIRCGKEIEDGGPQVDVGNGVLKKLCRGFKFNTSVCADRPHRYIWHPSFRTNAIKGYTLAMTLLEILEESIQQLPQDSNNHQDMKATQQQLRLLLNQLQGEEREDYQGIQTIPSGLGKWYREEETKHKLHQEIDLISLFRAPTLCRTALLPSVSRYYYQTRGAGKYLTTPYNVTYERGLLFSKLRKEDSKAPKGFRYPEPDRRDDLVTVTDKSGYFDCAQETLEIDHQDAYLVSSKMGWRSITIPNEEEHPLFGVSNAKGWIFVCLFVCDNSKCPEIDLHDRLHSKRFPKGKNPASMLEQYGQVEMEVNGIPVSNTTRVIDQKYSHLDNCLALKHNSSFNPHTWKANDSGTFLLRIRIRDATRWSYLKISSVILM